MKRLAFSLLCLLAVPAMAADQAILDRYQAKCAVCHNTGAAGAPKPGDAQWAKRMEAGIDAVLQNAKKGVRGMPPMGLCFDCSDEELTALIEYMAAPAEK